MRRQNAGSPAHLVGVAKVEAAGGETNHGLGHHNARSGNAADQLQGTDGVVVLHRGAGHSDQGVDRD